MTWIQSDPYGVAFCAGILLCVIGLLACMGAWEKFGIALIVIGLLVAVGAIYWMPEREAELRTSSAPAPALLEVRDA